MKQRILVADDEEPLRNLVAVFLDCCGLFDVTAVADGTAAVAAIAKAEVPFDLVITDFEMPGYNGTQVLAAAREKSPDTKVVIMTGNPQVAQEIQPGQADAVIAKPFTGDKLRALLKDLGSLQP
jgi:CheY-like chemotaxis protein